MEKIYNNTALYLVKTIQSFWPEALVEGFSVPGLTEAHVDRSPHTTLTDVPGHTCQREESRNNAVDRGKSPPSRSFGRGHPNERAAEVPVLHRSKQKPGHCPRLELSFEQGWDLLHAYSTVVALVQYDRCRFFSSFYGNFILSFLWEPLFL